MNEQMNIQWFPGHMTKAQRMIEENLRAVDIVCEITDARIPYSSRNPDVARLAGEKPRLMILNRTDLADPNVTSQWRAWFKSHGLYALETDSKSGKGVSGFNNAVRTVLKDKLAVYSEKGQATRPIRAMIVGIPNVGKSTFINKVARRKAAKASDKPGVTRGKQWITVDAGLELLDTPGILWPRFDNQSVGEALAYTGAISDVVVDTETLASNLLVKLRERYSGSIEARYKYTPPDDVSGFELLEMTAKKRGFIISGGVIDTERMAVILLDEFRAGMLGRISLERPGDFSGKTDV